MTFDELRRIRPELGFALYAFTPGDGVTLEVHTSDGNPYQFFAATAEAAIAQAFPSALSQTPLGAGSAPALRPTQDPPTLRGAGEAGGVAESVDSVFD